jgi:hypothetical protein
MVELAVCCGIGRDERLSPNDYSGATSLPFRPRENGFVHAESGVKPAPKQIGRLSPAGRSMSRFRSVIGISRATPSQAGGEQFGPLFVFVNPVY